MHSAEWLRGAVAVLGQSVRAVIYRRLLAEAEAREAAIARATQLHDTYPHTEEPSLADQLAAAQAEVARLSARVDALEDSMNPQDVQTVDAGIADREARMKAMGAAEALRTLNDRINAKRNTMLATFGSYTATDVQAVIREELQVLAEAERLAEGE